MAATSPTAHIRQGNGEHSTRAAGPLDAMLRGQIARFLQVTRQSRIAASDRSLIRSVIRRWVVTPEEPCERRKAVFQLVTGVVVGVWIHATTFRPTSIHRPQTDPLKSMPSIASSERSFGQPAGPRVRVQRDSHRNGSLLVFS
jgi:hypothetical protein